MTEQPRSEIETYRRELKNLLKDAGKFVLISGEKVLGIYGTYEDALKEGYKQCGMEPFLVKQIQQEEQVQYFTRDIGNSCHI